MLPTSVRPTVSPETITKVTRLFNGTLHDILTELLQNARRAGAQSVAIDFHELDGKLFISVADDGSGIEDPASLLALGSSGWNSTIAGREDPAGMGIFSLAGRDVLVTSRHQTHSSAWDLRIPADGWTGDIALDVAPASREIGTTIAFAINGMSDNEALSTVKKAAAFYPLPVTANGEFLPRRDFLEGACHIAEWNGSRIGVFTGFPGYRNPTINFHGLTVSSPLFNLAESLRGERFSTKVDIGDTPALQLVLPARKDIVANDAYAELKTACERAIFEAIAERWAHRLSFEQWQRASELGIALPEAEPVLVRWNPADASYRDIHSPRSERGVSGDPVIVEPCEPYIEQPLAHALRNESLFERLVEPHAPYEGYAWYDALPRLKAPCFHVAHGGQTTVLSEQDPESALPAHVTADAIELRFDLCNQDECTETRLPCDLAFDIDRDIWYDDVEHIRVAWTPSAELTPDVLVELFEAVAFCPSEDSDADSWDTQHERFLREARKAATEILLGADAAIAGEFRDLVLRHRWLLPKGRSLTIKLADDVVDVSIGQLPQAA